MLKHYHLRLTLTRDPGGDAHPDRSIAVDLLGPEHMTPSRLDGVTRRAFEAAAKIVTCELQIAFTGTPRIATRAGDAIERAITEGRMHLEPLPVPAAHPRMLDNADRVAEASIDLARKALQETKLPGFTPVSGCPTCSGAGTIHGNNPRGDGVITRCPTCHGTGEVTAGAGCPDVCCPTCKGEGEISPPTGYAYAPIRCPTCGGTGGH